MVAEEKEGKNSKNSDHIQCAPSQGTMVPYHQYQAINSFAWSPDQPLGWRLRSMGGRAAGHGTFRAADYSLSLDVMTAAILSWITAETDWY